MLVHYVDLGEFYSIYGVMTLVVVLALLWYFIKDNLDVNENATLNTSMEDETEDYFLIDDDSNVSNVSNEEPRYTKGHTQRLSHKEGLNNPDGDEDGDFGILGIEGVMFPEIEPVKLTKDGEQPAYHLQTGSYGDTPVVIYQEEDLIYSPEWGAKQQIYIPNTRSLWKKVNTPMEQTFWADEQYTGFEDPLTGETVLSRVM